MSLPTDSPPRVEEPAPIPAGLNPNVVALGLVSLLMGMSSAMIYGLMPVFLVTVMGASMAAVGALEGIAEATTSFMKIFSGYVSDRLGRRKPLVAIGYALSAVNKLVFPLADSVTMVLLARVADRVGKGIRDAPRDALLTDITPTRSRGTNFGLRLALYTIGAVIGPLFAIALMTLSDNDFRLVFWIALIPGALSVAVVIFGLTEPADPAGSARRPTLCWRDFSQLPAAIWWTIALTAILATARFSPAFLVLKMHHVGMNAAHVPAILAVMYVVYSASAYPFGILADRTDRTVQLTAGIAILASADLVLAFSHSVWMTALGAALWGLQMGVSQGLLTAVIGDHAPVHLRGTAFGLFDLAVGVATFTASACAGLLWTIGGPAMTFVTGASLCLLALGVLMLRPAIVARVA
jgi:MFS family permease